MNSEIDQRERFKRTKSGRKKTTADAERRIENIRKGVVETIHEFGRNNPYRPVLLHYESQIPDHLVEAEMARLKRASENIEKNQNFNAKVAKEAAKRFKRQMKIKPQKNKSASNSSESQVYF